MKLNLVYTYATPHEQVVNIDENAFLNWCYEHTGDSSNVILRECRLRNISPNQFFLENHTYIFGYLDSLGEAKLSELTGWGHTGIVLSEVELLDD